MLEFAYDLSIPEGRVAEGRAHLVTLPGAAGEMGLMAGHACLASLLRAGLLRIHGEGGVRDFFISGGFVQMDGERALILADGVEDLGDLDAGAIDVRLGEVEEGSEEARLLRAQRGALARERK